MTPRTPLHLLTHPYDGLEPVEQGAKQLRVAARAPGSALVWQMRATRYETTRALAEARPGGLSLIVVLPQSQDLAADPNIIHAVYRCRPHGILPHHGPVHASDLKQVLRRPPLDLAAEVTDYLKWRGLVVDRDTVQLLRRIIELSKELRSITALSRGMYLSRRALGRRLMTRGLPVPSHWLQLARILRLASKLQNSDASIFSVACDSGYPDGFSLSNQMHRLVGYRPTEVRERLGWEWILEAWLRREAAQGGLAPASARRFVPDGPGVPPPSATAAASRGRSRRKGTVA